MLMGLVAKQVVKEQKYDQTNPIVINFSQVFFINYVYCPTSANQPPFPFPWHAHAAIFSLMSYMYSVLVIKLAKKEIYPHYHTGKIL